VTPFDFSEFAQETFGGEEKPNSYNYNAGMGFGTPSEKTRNAYILFYKRK
jgi:hypothetical protein